MAADKHHPKGEGSVVSNEGIEKALEDIETLQRELKELKTDHTEVTKQLKQELLELRRFTATLKVSFDSVNIRSIIQHQLPNKSHLISQVLVDTTSAKTQIKTSTKPFTIATQFYDKWLKVLKDSKARIIIT